VRQGQIVLVLGAQLGLVNASHTGISHYYGARARRNALKELRIRLCA